MRELWRRLVFLICVCGAVLLALAASLSPVVLVTPVDFAREQQREGSYIGFRIPTEESKRQQNLTREAYIAEKTKGRLVAGNDPQWTELFGAVAALAQDKALAERLRQHRLVRKQRAAKRSMGAKHVLHPNYRFNPRHSNDSAIYPHFRQHYLDTIRDAAELARSNNPAHCRHAARLARLY